MATALFADAELICFDHDIKMIRKTKNQHQHQHQRTDIKSIHKNYIHQNSIVFIKIPDYRDVSKEFLNIRIEDFLKKW